MREITALGISRGIAIGHIYRFNNQREIPPKRLVHNARREILRFEQARLSALDTLEQLYQRMRDQLGEQQACIFLIHKELLSDDSFVGKVRSLMETRHLAAEWAVQTVCCEFKTKFSRMKNAYIRQRAADVQDISDRLLQNLQGFLPPDPSSLGGRFILATADLTPSETVQMDCHNVLGIITAEGSKVSHAAILARSLDIPAVAGIGMQALSSIAHKTIAIVDGVGGKVILEPDERTLQEYRRRQRELAANRERLQCLRGQESQTIDGTKVLITAQLSLGDESSLALENDAMGIGLFRSDYLYIEHSQLPTETEQYQAYKQVLEEMQGRPVTIRTLNLDEEKVLGRQPSTPVENPALGCRAIRFCLRNQKLFCTQLRALLRASVCGNLSILLPMITSVGEVVKAKSLLAQCRADLESEGICPAHSIPVGVMIETPASVMIAEELAQHADFFLIESNDLTQFTLAVDRGSRQVGQLFEYRHPAVLRMVSMVAAAAAERGISCCVSGELADDVALTEQLLTMGVNAFAVSPNRILELKATVRGILLHNHE